MTTKISLPKQELEKLISLLEYTNINPETVSFFPISGYALIQIKRGFCKITLSSERNFLIYNFSTTEQDNTILLNIFKLRDYLSTKRGANITITDSEEKCSLSDGIFTIAHGKETGISIGIFPKLPEIKGVDFKRVDKKLINQLSSSKKFVLPENKDKLRPIFNLSSIKGNLMLSSDGHISCIYKISEAIGEFSVFSKKEVDLVENFDFFDYFKLENWNLIKYKTIVYGNLLSEYIDPGTIHETIETFVSATDKTKIIRVNVEQFYDFCKSIKSQAKDQTVNSYLQIKEGKVELSYNDKQNSIEAHQLIDSKNQGYEIGYKICFVQNSLIKVLDSLKSEYINISECIVEDGFGVKVKPYITFWTDNDESFHSVCSKGFES